MGWLLSIVVVVLGFSGAIGPVWSAETHSSPAPRKTQFIVKLATDEVIPIQSRFEREESTIIIEFPPGRVAGMLPEHSAVQQGVIKDVQTVYASATKPGEPRWIQALKVHLQGPYTYTVRPEAGQIVVEIDRPTGMVGQDVELGLNGGTVISGTLPPAFSERFRAMQEALNLARAPSQVRQAASSTGATAIATSPNRIGTPFSRAAANASSSAASQRGQRRPDGAFGRWIGLSASWWLWLLGGIGVAAGFIGARWWRRRRIRTSSTSRRTPSASSSFMVPAGVRIIDQLVWKAFERQSYQVLHLVEIGEPLGLMRVIEKDGAKAALLCIGDDAFLEKTTVEQFLGAIRKVQVGQGFLVAPGSFTIPAQRCAKEHGITLLGRDELMQLLSDGAISEYYTKQLQELHKQLEDAQETVSEYARQLDTIRRQRNEASWFLGEEHAKTAKLEAQINELTQQLADGHAQAEQQQQAIEALRKQWEESQWYLGEARAFGRYLEEQARVLHDAVGELEQRHREIAAKLTEMERERDEANWYLGESQSAGEALQAQQQELSGQLEQARAHLDEMQRALEESQQHAQAERSHRFALEDQLKAVRSSGERRRALRVYRPKITMEVRRPDGEIVFRGVPRDVSGTGFGFDPPRPFEELPDYLHVRLYGPDAEQPVDATSRLVWQYRDGMAGASPSGCEFLDMTTEGRQLLERALTTA